MGTLVTIMEKNTQISILIGAGFSTEAGIPTRNEINFRLKNLKASEFFIDSEGTTHFLKQPNPNSNWLHINERNFIEEMILFYNSIISNDFDYEDFYDYCFNLLSDIDNQKFDTFFKNYKAERNNGLDKWRALDITIRTLDYLVSDLLNFNKDIFKTNIIDNYQPFLSLLRNLQERFEIVNIFSLNHDLLLEKIFISELNFEFCDGFEFNGSRYYIKKRDRQIRIKCFKNRYDKQVRLFKLHGSIDNYLYNISSPYEMVKIPKDLYAPDLHRETRKGNRWIEEQCWTLYQPNFLSGTTTKILKYDKHQFHITQFKHFRKSLKNSKLLIAIGYGLQDEKINEFIKKELSKNLKMVVVKRTKSPKEFFQIENVFHYGNNLGIVDIKFNQIEMYL